MEEQQPVADEAAESPEVEEQPPQGPFVPAEVTMVRPSGVNVEKFPDGSVQLELLVSPFKVIAFSLPPDAVKALTTQLSSGIEIARSIPQVAVPSGRG